MSANPDPREFDRIPPGLDFLILDADSSQQAAIAAVLAGQSTVVHGPPGTGKSQTIPNLIASLAADGKRVLFVAEKRAALEVVSKRLKKVGLEKLAIDLHGADISTKRVMEEVAAALNDVRRAVVVDSEAMHQRFVDRRDRLNRHVERLHRKRDPSGLSVYELQGELLRLPDTTVRTRWRRAELNRIGLAGAESVRDQLRDATAFWTLVLRVDPSPWNGVRIPDGGSAQRAIDLVNKASSESLPEFEKTISEFIEESGLNRPTDLAATRSTYSLGSEVQSTLERYAPQLFDADLEQLTLALSPSRRGGIRALYSWLSNAEFRRARRKALELRSTSKVSTKHLYTEIEAARSAPKVGGTIEPKVKAKADRKI